MLELSKMRFVLVLAIATALLILSASAFAQQSTGSKNVQKQGGKTDSTQTKQAGSETAKPSASPAAAAVVPGKKWNLRISKTAPLLVSLQAQKVSLTEIAGDLSRQLNVPVLLSSVMEKQKITADFVKYPLEAAVRALSPQVFIDYEVTGDYSVQPKPIAIYLYAFNEPPPAANTVVKGTSEAILIEGNTEEGTDAAASSPDGKKEESPLSVTFEKNQLTVRARKQPLSVVLYEIASKIGVPLEVRTDSTDLVDVSYSNYSVEQALRSLSPSVRFYYRANLSTADNQPLRIVLSAPAKS
jgi:hypothetical protein